MCAEPIYHRAHHKEANSRWGRVCVHTPFLPRDNVMWLHSSMPRSNSQSPQTLSLTPPSRRGRVLNTSWGAQDVAWHVMVMTMHRVSMEMHWLLSIVAQCHMIITCKPHGMKLIGMHVRIQKQAQESTWCILRPFFLFGWDLGMRLRGLPDPLFTCLWCSSYPSELRKGGVWFTRLFLLLDPAQRHSQTNKNYDKQRNQKLKLHTLDSCLR